MAKEKVIEDVKEVKQEVKVPETKKESKKEDLFPKYNAEGKKIVYEMVKVGKDPAGNPIWKKSQKVLRTY